MKLKNQKNPKRKEKWASYLKVSENLKKLFFFSKTPKLLKNIFVNKNKKKKKKKNISLLLKFRTPLQSSPILKKKSRKI